MEEGQTVAEMLEGIDAAYVDVHLNGVHIPRDMWKYCRPKAGSNLEVVAYPQSSERGRKIAAIAVAVAIIAGTQYIGAGGLGDAGVTKGAFAAGGIGANLTSLGLSLAGALAIRALIKPISKSPSSRDVNRQDYTLTGASNNANPFGAVPIVI
jgi:predicted phage tail protein